MSWVRQHDQFLLCAIDSVKWGRIINSQSGKFSLPLQIVIIFNKQSYPLCSHWLHSQLKTLQIPGSRYLRQYVVLFLPESM